MAELKFSKVVLAGIIYAVIAQIVHTLEALLTMDYYIDPSYFPLWSKIMMPTAGAPGAEFFSLSIIFGVIMGWIYTYVYMTIRGSIKDENPFMRGAKFGWLLFLVAGIPMFLTSYLLLNIPLGLLFTWLTSGFIIFLVGGAAIGRIMK